MLLKKIHLGHMLYGRESNEDIKSIVNSYITEKSNGNSKFQFRRSRASIFAKAVGEFVIALALCHNVTPTIDENRAIEYQASSPDEIAILEWTHSVGLSLLSRSTTELVLALDESDIILRFEILAIFPFTSERKRMGILIRDLQSNDIMFYLKGADSVMIPRIKGTDWVEEEVGNMSREGLRTLVIASKGMTETDYNLFKTRYNEANSSMVDRLATVELVINDFLEKNLDVLGVTGVEDGLQVLHIDE